MQDRLRDIIKEDVRAAKLKKREVCLVASVLF
jgi:hypothetical protein